MGLRINIKASLVVEAQALILDTAQTGNTHTVGQEVDFASRQGEVCSYWWKEASVVLSDRTEAKRISKHDP